MANVEITFLGTKESETQKHKLNCFSNEREELCISISSGNTGMGFICLDVSTSIKLTKVLRQEINKIKGGSNV